MDLGKLRSWIEDLRHHDSVFWRRAIRAGVTYGPDAFVRYSPPVFGLAFAAALKKQRAAVRRNLKLARGARGPLADNLDVARVFTTYASCLTEAFVAASDRGDPLIARCPDDGLFVEAAREGRGVIVTTAHTGGWHQAGQILRQMHDADVIVVMRRERDARAERIQREVKDRSGLRLMHIGDDPLDALTLLGHLRRGGVVAVQIDRLPEGLRGRQVELFNTPWLVPEGPFRLASASGAPIVPVFTRRLSYMEYDVHIAEPIRVPRRATERDLDAAARALANEVERFVAENPTQWFHFE